MWGFHYIQHTVPSAQRHCPPFWIQISCISKLLWVQGSLSHHFFVSSASEGMLLNQLQLNVIVSTWTCVATDDHVSWWYSAGHWNYASECNFNVKVLCEDINNLVSFTLTFSSTTAFVAHQMALWGQPVAQWLRTAGLCYSRLLILVFIQVKQIKHMVFKIRFITLSGSICSLLNFGGWWQADEVSILTEWTKQECQKVFIKFSAEKSTPAVNQGFNSWTRWS